MALSVLAAMGHQRVIACDIDETKLQAAAAVGAAATVNLKTTPGPAELLKISGIGLAHMVDFVGAPATSQLAMPALRKGGQLVVVGLFGGALPVPLPALAMREVSLRGSAVGNTAQIRELVQMVREGKLKLPAVQVRPLAQAEPRCATWRRGASSDGWCWTRPKKLHSRSQLPGGPVSSEHARCRSALVHPAPARHEQRQDLRHLASCWRSTPIRRCRGCRRRLRPVAGGRDAAVELEEADVGGGGAWRSAASVRRPRHDGSPCSSV